MLAVSVLTVRNSFPSSKKSAAFCWGGRTYGVEGSELDRSGDCTICEHPFSFYIHLSDTVGVLCACCARCKAGRKQSRKWSADGKLCCFSFCLSWFPPLLPPSGLHRHLCSELEAVWKLTWFNPLTACWVNSKLTWSSPCSRISRIWWTFSLLIA